MMAMSRRLDAVDQVMGQLFDRRRKTAQGAVQTETRKAKSGRGKAGSSSGSFASNRMSRVGARHGQAIFKLVTKGGTDTRSGLKGQLNYIFRDDKAARIIDPSGTIESHELVSNDKLNEITLAWSNDWWKGTRNGQTSHMILSFPRDVSIDDVTEITRDVCEEKFNTGDARYEYVVAIHDDQEHHPHAHIVLNRRASDNTLFQMRQGTENSYEGFREAMAAHAERRGIFLDPTSRFERGITDRQPTRTEQIEAYKEGRTPQQRPRNGVDLDYANEQVSLAQIGYQAMAVVAINADCDRLKRAYLDVAKLIVTDAGSFEMPDISADEFEKFDEYASLLNASLEDSQAMMASKSPAERVPFETDLSDTMRAFTALNPEASYAKDLHQPANGNSIYMHEFEGKDERWAQAQDRILEISKVHGLDAGAVSARLETRAPNQYLEHLWMLDDLRNIANVKDVNLNDNDEYRDVVHALTEAYQSLREELVPAHVLRPAPLLEYDYLDANGKPQLTQAERASLEDCFGRTDFLYELKTGNDDRETGRQQVEAAVGRFIDFAELSSEHATFASELWDKSTDRYTPEENYLSKDERLLATMDVVLKDRFKSENREVEISAHHETKADPFAKWKERSPDRYSLTKTGADCDAVMDLIRENTTAAQFTRLRQGDLSAIEHITKDPVFSRQLLAEVELENQDVGYQLTREQENRMTESREFLTKAFASERDNDYENER
jgi:type IV secretion system T-DNA border endonuclease VirD2